VWIALACFAGVCVGIPLLLSSLRAIFGLMFYYRNSYQFQKRLFYATNAGLSFWQRLLLLKLLCLRIGTAIIPALLVVYGIVLCIFGVAELIDSLIGDK